MKIEIINEQFDPWVALVNYKREKLNNDPKIGATSVFLGTMRDFNDDKEVESMMLEHYPEMTEKYLTDILTNAIKKFKLIDGIIFHRIGDLKPSDPIVLVATWSEHRDSAFKATREIMEFLKSEAPLWKKESNSNGFKWVESQNVNHQEELNETD
ncbi:MAG: molybdopterin converting factor [Gammaproteobacteria bacterium]|nr:molybdopterin converting factor [Gammaproteobacteria bacterium]|tara:strand:+ start:130 stop:594 length:465 start_codon:yes stop_codon:yes gene_type:complete